MGAKKTTRLTNQEAVAYLRKKRNVPAHFRKIFTKIWGASGTIQNLFKNVPVHYLTGENS